MTAIPEPSAAQKLPGLKTLPSLPALSPLPGQKQLVDITPTNQANKTLPTTYPAYQKNYDFGSAFDKDNGQNISYSSDTLSLKQFLWLFLEGIAQGVETKGHHNAYYATNPYSSAHGRWQMTNAFWQHYSYLYCGSMNLPRHILPRTPRNQRLIAYWAARDMFWRHYQPWRSPLQIISLMAKEWYGGKKFLNASWDIVPYPWQNKLTFRQYAQRVINKIFKLNQGKKIILTIKQTGG